MLGFSLLATMVPPAVVWNGDERTEWGGIGGTASGDVYARERLEGDASLEVGEEDAKGGEDGKPEPKSGEYSE